MTWHDRTWHFIPWHDMTFHPMTWHDRTGQERTGHDRTGQDTTRHTHTHIYIYIYRERERNSGTVSTHAIRLQDSSGTFSLDVPGPFQQAPLKFQVAAGEGKHLSPHKEVGCVSCTIGKYWTCMCMPSVCSMLPNSWDDLPWLNQALKGATRISLNLLSRRVKHQRKPMGSMFLGYSTIWRHLGHPQLSTGRLSAVWSTGHGPKWNLKSQCCGLYSCWSQAYLKRVEKTVNPHSHWSISCWFILPLSLTQLITRAHTHTFHSWFLMRRFGSSPERFLGPLGVLWAQSCPTWWKHQRIEKKNSRWMD